MEFTFRSLAEDRLGPVWQREFHTRWPDYLRWFTRHGESERPTYLESLKALKSHFPEMLGLYENMVELAGGGDHAARFLAQFCPPPLFRGCSQAVYIKDEPVIVRNYDYSPYVFDGLILRSHFDQRAVIATIDCMSGVLDGMNADGLAVSMSFGGREEFGEGFGITLLLRYVLEYARNVAEACELVKSIPVHGAYNVTLVDSDANIATLIIAPGVATRISTDPIATNHQPGSHWPRYQDKVKSTLRFDHLNWLAAQQLDSLEEFTHRFLQPPLYNNQFGRGFGTLYTAAYYPCRGECHYLWPDHSWRFNFNQFVESEYRINFIDPEGYPLQSESYGEVYTSQRIPGLTF